MGRNGSHLLGSLAAGSGLGTSPGESGTEVEPEEFQRFVLVE